MNATFAPALRLPCAFGLDLRKPTGYRAAPHRHAQIVDLAKHRRWSMQAFLDWALDQILDLDFLDLESREEVQRIACEAGAPYTALDVVAGLVRAALAQMRAGKLVPALKPGQLSLLKMFGSR